MVRRILPVLCLFCSFGCMEGSKREPPLQRVPSLYSRLKGEPRLDKVIDELIVGIANSKDLEESRKASFLQGNVEETKRALREQLCGLLGGPQQPGRGEKSKINLLSPDLENPLGEAMRRAQFSETERDQVLTELQAKRNNQPLGAGG